MQLADYEQFAPPNFDHLEALTRQETKILGLAAEDLSNKEIATKLGISEATVKKHRLNIYSKLGICGKRAVRKFLRQTCFFLHKS